MIEGDARTERGAKGRERTPGYPTSPGYCVSPRGSRDPPSGVYRHPVDFELYRYDDDIIAFVDGHRVDLV